MFFPQKYGHLQFVDFPTGVLDQHIPLDIQRKKPLDFDWYVVLEPPNTLEKVDSANRPYILLMEEILHHLGCLKPVVNNGIIIILGGAGFQPSTVLVYFGTFY